MAIKVQIFRKAGKYGEGKASTSRWTQETNNVIGVSDDCNKKCKLEGKAKSYLRHEHLLVS